MSSKSNYRKHTMNNLIGFDAEPSALEMAKSMVSPKYKKKPKESSGSIDINTYGPPPIPANTQFSRQKPNYGSVQKKSFFNSNKPVVTQSSTQQKTTDLLADIIHENIDFDLASRQASGAATKKQTNRSRDKSRKKKNVNHNVTEEADQQFSRKQLYTMINEHREKNNYLI